MIKVGDLVEVVSGPAYYEGLPLTKGRVTELFTAKTMTGAEPAAVVKTSSGGEWGFRAEDLRVAKARRLR